MNAPDVTLTDYALTLLCWVLAWRTIRVASSDVRGWLAAFFLGAGAAALFGGTYHGFFEESDGLGRGFWPATLLAIGGTAVAAWGLGARVGGVSDRARLVSRLATVAFLVYGAIVLAGAQSFAVAVGFYLPAVVFLTVRFVLAHRAEPTAARASALWGLGLTFVAAAIQGIGIPLHPVYFDHNALYHVVQGLAFVLFYRGAVRE